MKLTDYAHKPELCVGEDPFRPQLTHMHLDVTAKALVATDGKVLIAVPVELETTDKQGPVTVEALKAARKACPKRTPPEIAINGDQRLPNGVVFPRPDLTDSQFPEWTRVLPKQGYQDRNTVCVTVDAELLLRLQKALGAKAITLAFPLPKAGETMLDPIAVKHSCRPWGAGVSAVVMPWRGEQGETSECDGNKKTED